MKMFSDEIFFRHANLDDLKLLFKLRNDDSVRKNSIEDEQIDWNCHTLWLKKIISDDSKKLYLFFAHNDFIGQVRFDIELNKAVINISISNPFRGRGLANIILFKSINHLFKNKNEIISIIALIKPDNIPSIKSFERIGFRFVSKVKIKNVQFNEYLLLRENYE